MGFALRFHFFITVQVKLANRRSDKITIEKLYCRKHLVAMGFRRSYILAIEEAPECNLGVSSKDEKVTQVLPNKGLRTILGIMLLME